MEQSAKVALVHDWLVRMRGGEKVLQVFCELFPQATLFTLLHKPGAVSQVIDKMDIRTSFIEWLPRGMKNYQHYLPLYPTAIESFDLKKYDLVLSSSHAAAKGVRVRSNALHICYCHTPMRYIWDQYEQYFGPGRSSAPVRFAMKRFRSYLQHWDVKTAKRVDYFIANSHNVQERIERIYGRSSAVIYPPVDVNQFSVSARDDGYYLVVSALVPYKRIDIAVDAFNRLGKRLLVVGSGAEEKRLKRLAKANIEFLGYLSDDDVRRYYEGCRALIFPGEEDFGIVPVEAMACGKPVIAFRKGGALETVVDGKTGLFFEAQTAESLEEGVRRFGEMSFDAEAIRQHAMQFSQERFKEEMQRFINEKMDT